MSNPQRFRDREVVFANGVRGQTIDIRSASPLNYWQAISAPAAMPRVTVDGKLFLPTDAKGRLPVVVIVPGSLSIAASHLRHAETLVGMGIAAFVLDPFGARGVTSTVANQAQFSFAASAYDVAATVDVLSKHPALDSTRIGLWGVSLGGYYAPRAVAFEKRIKACIGLAGPYDFRDTWDKLPDLTREAFRVRSHCATQAEARIMKRPLFQR